MSDDDEDDRSSKGKQQLKAAIFAELSNVSVYDMDDSPPTRQFHLKAVVGAKAPCWKTFSKVFYKDTLRPTGFVSCNKCFHVYAFSQSTGTSSLNKHTCNGVKGSESIIAYAQPLPGTVRAADKLKITKALASMCSLDLAPFSQVQDKGFLLFSETMLKIGMTLKRPVSIMELLPCPNTVKNHVVELAKHVLATLKDICEKHFKDRIGMAFTTDLWTDSIKKRSFMSVTCHYIDEKFHLNARTLQVKVFHEESHTAVAILEAFQQCLKDFGCDRPELCTVVSDSGSNMAAANGIRKNYTWLPCCDHKIATIITTVLNKSSQRSGEGTSVVRYKFLDDAPDVFALIDACKEVVTYFKQANLQNKLSSTLKQENATRWNSLLRLLQSISNVYDELLPILTLKKKAGLFYSINKELLDELVAFLLDYQRATLILEQFKAPTLHIVAYEKSNLILACSPVLDTSDEDSDGDEEVHHSDSTTMKAVKNLLLEHGHPKWGNHVMYVVAALLDPNQKRRLLLFGITQDEIDAAYDKLASIMVLVGEGKTKSTDNGREANLLEEARPQPAPAKRQKTRPKAVSMYGNSSDGDESECDGDERRTAENRRSTTIREKVQDEIDRYKLLKPRGKADTDILNWWKEKSTQIDGLPIMARAARTILCIPASSSMSECNFSDAGNTITSKRNALSESIVDDTLVVRSNQDLI